MIENSKKDGSFWQSHTWINSKYEYKIVITYNIDKGGNDITTSIRLLNRFEGNSMKHTYPIATVGGPVCECYDNEKDTIFNAIYPIGNILQGWADDLFFTLTAMTPSNECRSMLFLPIPTHGVCENRSISVEL